MSSRTITLKVNDDLWEKFCLKHASCDSRSAVIVKMMADDVGVAYSQPGPGRPHGSKNRVRKEKKEEYLIVDHGENH